MYTVIILCSHLTVPWYSGAIFSHLCRAQSWLGNLSPPSVLPLSPASDRLCSTPSFHMGVQPRGLVLLYSIHLTWSPAQSHSFSLSGSGAVFFCVLVPHSLPKDKCGLHKALCYSSIAVVFHTEAMSWQKEQTSCTFKAVYKVLRF